MLRLIVNILVLLLLIRLLRPVFRGLGKVFSPQQPSPQKPTEKGEGEPFSDLTPYEIEDADYEEIKKEK